MDGSEVHLFRADLEQPISNLDDFTSSLSPDEQARGNRFHFEKHRHRFKVARSLLRLLLARYLKTAPDTIQFQYGAKGKPFLCPDTDHGPHASKLRFNLAHSAHRGIYAFSWGAELGVDLEYIRDDRDLEAIARRFFAPGEVVRWLELSAPERVPAFFEIWTRKEAYIKACGGGLSLPLSRFEVSFGKDHPCRLRSVEWDPAESDRWTMADLDAGEGFRGALAVARKNPVLIVQDWQHDPKGFE